jgi:hypothetical protein
MESHQNDNAQGDEWSCRVSMLAIGKEYQQYQCYFQSLEKEGLVFGGCLCGLPKMHMEFLAVTWWQWSNLVALRGLLR